MNPRVSVSLVTYNQADVIREAIEGALAQRTPFDVEIVIGEDGSTDGTREIVCDYGRRYPERIRLLLQDQNRGLVTNFMNTIGACRGEYVALLDGDDYWPQRDKLARQVTFLDRYPRCSLSFHDVVVLCADGTFSAVTYTGPDHKRFSGIEDLLETNFVATCSAMFRRSALPAWPDWFAASIWEDWPLYLLLAEHGSIGYIPEILGVYRDHRHGLWSGLPQRVQIERTIDFLRSADEHLDYRYADAIAAAIVKHRRALASLESDHGVK